MNATTKLFAVVTGASSGIGYELARQFAEHVSRSPALCRLAFRRSPGKQAIEGSLEEQLQHLQSEAGVRQQL